MIMLPVRAKVWSLVVVFTAALVPKGAFAQTTTVTYLSSFGWMNNSLEQGPCLVTAYLLSACGGVFNIGPLPFGDFYSSPSGPGANPCQCNTVYYSMISACSVCQNGSYVSWSEWSSDCSSTADGRYPLDIPTATKVPNWAYLSLTDGQFDTAAAQSNGDLPESSATGAYTTTVIHSTTLPASLTTVYTSSTTTTGPSTSSGLASSNVGAIAGGVVGGIAGAAVIIGLVTWFFVKRRRSSTTLSAGFSNVGGSPGCTQSFYSTNTTIFPMAQQPRLYDPSDPTTFPVHPHPTGLVTSSNDIVMNPSLSPPAYTQQLRLGHKRNLERCLSDLLNFFKTKITEGLAYIQTHLQ
ncbi:hypothetical protein BDR07DRAFT_62936 [Suillus spraguei]|nr:hypothetical protein BDR07DRAFT_62936 [Suillus spraguei]